MAWSTSLSTLDNLDSTELYKLILETSEIFTCTSSFNEAYEKFALALRKLVQFDRVNITFFDETDRTVTTHFLLGKQLPDWPLWQRKPIAGTRAEQMLQTGQTIIEEDIALHHPQSAGSQAALRSGLHSSIAVPLFSRGEIMGALSLRHRLPGVYGSREQTILELLAALIAPWVERDRLAMRISTVDPGRGVAATLPGTGVPGQSSIDNDEPNQQLYLGVILSPREQSVLKQVARGSSNEDIAETLQLSTNTVKTHVRNILRKLHVSNRVQAALVVLNSEREAPS